MQRRRLWTRIIVLAAFFSALVALHFTPMPANAAETKPGQARYNASIGHITVTLTPRAIIVTPSGTLTGGNHILTVRNMSRGPHGVEIIGIDIAGSPVIRYSKVLKPRQSQSFRWYVAPHQTEYIRDITSCYHNKRNCMVVTYGRLSKALQVR